MPTDKNTFSKQKSSKRKLLIVALIAILFIPIVWAFMNAKTLDGKGYSGTQFEITLYDPQNELIVSDASVVEYSSVNSAITIFNQIITNMQKIDASAVDLTKLSSPITADITKEKSTAKYSFYFSEIGDCYCSDANGQLYLIVPSDAEKFLTSSYSECIYKSAAPPLLLTGNNEEVIPKTARWNYKNKAQNFVSASEIKTSSETLVYKISGSFDIRFESVPDECNIRIYRDDTLIFNGTYQELDDMAITTETRLKVDITARWSYNEATDYYGETTYSFKADVNNYANFTVNDSQVSQNGFLIISGMNVENIFNIEFTPILQEGVLIYPHSPAFISIGENTYGVLTFSDDMEIGTYSFNITYGTFSKDFTVELLPAQEAPIIYNTQKSLEEMYFFINNTAQQEFEQITSTIHTDISNEIYFYDTFLDHLNLGYKIEYLYDTFVSCDDESLMFQAIGNRYYSDDETRTTVQALNGGKVVFKGYCNYLGNFVIIEHIGRIGQHGTAQHDGFLLLCSLYDSFVNTNYCLKNNIKLK